MADNIMSGFGPEQFTKMMESFHVPGMDMKAIMEAQRKNVEALTKATQVATEGATAVTHKQAEIMREALQQATAMVREFKMTGNPAEIAKAQQELVKKAFETAVANARELAEMVGKSNREAFSVIEHRMKESMEELRKSSLGNGAA
jgi:phasin family protein